MPVCHTAPRAGFSVEGGHLHVGVGLAEAHGGFPKLGVPLGDPYNKEDNILGSILGSPHFRKLQHEEPEQPSRGPAETGELRCAVMP